jgi:hypothetical protein
MYLSRDQFRLLSDANRKSTGCVSFKSNPTLKYELQEAKALEKAGLLSFVESREAEDKHANGLTIKYSINTFKITDLGRESIKNK